MSNSHGGGRHVLGPFSRDVMTADHAVEGLARAASQARSELAGMKLAASLEAATKAAESFAQSVQDVRPSGGGGGGGSGASASVDAGKLGDQLKSAFAPMYAFAARFEASFERVGGTIVTLARRLDQAMKAPHLDEFLIKVRDKMPTAFGKAAVEGVRAFEKITSAIHNMGDVAGKNLSQVSKINFSSAIPGLGAVRGGMGAIGGAAGMALGPVVAIGAALAATAGFVGVAYSAVSFLEKSVKSASDLNETLDKTRIVLGGGTEAVEKLANEMGAKFGIVKRDTLETASGFGALAKGLAGLQGKELGDVSVKLTKMAADLGSLANIDMKEAGDAMKISLSGEQSDTMKRLGVVVNETTTKMYAAAHGIGALNRELTEGEKFQARLGLITEKLADANDNLALTANSPANLYRRLTGTIENLAASIGESLMPVVQPVGMLLAKGAAAAAAAFESLKPQVMEFASSIFPAVGSAVAYVADMLASTFDYLASVAASILPMFGGAWEVVKGTVAGTMVVISGGVNIMMNVAKAAAFVGVAFAGMSDVMLGTNLLGFAKRLESKIQGMADALAKGPEKSAWGDKVRNIFDGISKAAKESASAVSKAGQAMANVGNPIKEFAGDIDKLETSLRAQIEAFGKSGTEADLYKLKMRGASDQDLATARGLSQNIEGLKNEKAARDELSQAAQSVIQETRRPAERYDAKLKELTALLDKNLIDVDVFNRASAASFKDNFGDGKAAHAGLAKQGSQEAYTAILRGQGAGREGEPIQRVAKNGEKQLSEAQKQTGLLGKLLSLGNGTNGSPVFSMGGI